VVRLASHTPGTPVANSGDSVHSVSAVPTIGWRSREAPAGNL
jgi:hypothetical protein